MHHALGRFGGGEKLTILHSINLKRMGFDVDLFYGGPINEDWRCRVASEVNLRDFPFAISNSSPDIKNLFKIARWLEEFDVILFHHHVDPISAFLLTNLIKKEIIWYCGEPLRALWEDWLSGNSYKALGVSVKATSSKHYGKIVTKVFLSSALYGITVNLLRSLDVATVINFKEIVANSYYTRKVVSRLYRINGEVPVIHPGVDLNLNSNHLLDPDPDPKEEDYKILSVGAMIPMKNYPNIIRAFSYLPQKLKSSLKLIIIGDGPERKNIRSLISKLNLKKHVIIRRKVTERELEGFYRECRFVVNTTLHEPFGLVPLEAALFCKPSIVSNIGGMKEFVVPEKTGIVVDPLNPKEISRSMQRLIEDENLAIKMGLKARERVIKKFRVEDSTKKIASILDRLC